MNYLYIIMYSFVPKRSIFGRSQVAVTLLTASFFFIIISISLWIEYLYNIRFLNLLSVLVIFCVLFVFFRLFFLDRGRLSRNLKKYESLNKWMLRLAGIIFLILSFTSQIITGIILTILKID